MDGNSDYLESLFKEMYSRELERAEKIYANLSLPAAIIVGLTSLTWFYFASTAGSEWGVLRVIVCVVCAALVVCLTCAGYFLVRAVFKYENGFVLSPGQLEQYVNEVRAHYEAYGANQVEARTETHVRSVLRAQYVQAGQLNWMNNARKSDYRYKMHKALVVALAILVASLIPFALFHSLCKTGSGAGVAEENARQSETAVGTGSSCSLLRTQDNRLTSFTLNARHAPTALAR